MIFEVFKMQQVEKNYNIENIVSVLRIKNWAGAWLK
jgi:hypothetical protein